MSSRPMISRRTCLKGMAPFSAAVSVPLILASTAAEAKASKAAVHYRDYPSGMRMCQNWKFLHFDRRRSLRDDGVSNGRWHDGTRHDGGRSVPSSRR